MKMLGAALIFIGCCSVGIYTAILHKRELGTLQKLAAVLDLMSCELQYRMTPLPELCRMVAKDGRSVVHSLFGDLSMELECQVCPDVASCMTTVLTKQSAIPKQTEECLIQLGSCMGRFDLSGQLKGMESVRQKCRQLIEKLNENKEDRLRGYRTLGLCAGAAIAILFI